MAELTLTEEELETLKAIFLSPEQQEKLKDLRIRDNTLHADYRDHPVEAILKVTPKG